jgi:hypothetical protein
LPEAPIAEISGSFGSTYSYSPDFPPIAGQSPLLLPSSQAKPRACVVVEVDVVNQEAFAKEFPAAVKTIVDQGGKFLARGGKQ